MPVPRLIPANAGNTQPPSSVGVGVQAHPRQRGEHRLDGEGLMVLPGSSPPTRGTLLEQWEREGYQGLIPANAGNTRTAHT